jgi:hypothetical protein
MVANNEPIDPNLLSSSEMTSEIQVISEVQGSNPHPPKSTGKPKVKKATDTTNGEESTSKGHSRSYVESEDLQLCKSWVEVSKDPKKGTDQTFNTFWQTVAQHPSSGRTAKSLKSCWSDRIQREVNKFAGCVNQIQNLNPSGTNSSNRFTMAMSLYSKLYNKPFTFLGCYEILLASPKWNDYCRDIKKKDQPTPSNKQKEPNSGPPPASLSTQSSSHLPSTNTSVNSSGDETSVPPTRPIGHKRAKEDLAAANTSKKNQESLNKMAQAHCDIAEAAKKQVAFLDSQQAAMNRLANELIMCKDLSGVSETMKKYYEFEQMKILARMEKERLALMNPLAASNTSNTPSSTNPSNNTPSSG